MKLIIRIRKSMEPYLLYAPNTSPSQRLVDGERLKELEKERKKRESDVHSLLKVYPLLAVVLNPRPLTPSEEIVNNSRLPLRRR